MLTEQLCQMSENLDESAPTGSDASDMTDDAMSSITEVSEMDEMSEDEDEVGDGEIEQHESGCEESVKQPLTDASEAVSKQDQLVQINLQSLHEPLDLVDQPMSVEKMEQMLEEETKRRDEITNFLRRQETVLSHLGASIFHSSWAVSDILLLLFRVLCLSNIFGKEQVVFSPKA